METNEIMTNEVVEATEEVIVNNSMNTLKTLGIIGGVLLGSGLAYKYMIKPIIQKRKVSKNLEEAVEVESSDVVIEEGSEEE